MNVQIKRVYDAPAASDGYRVLVDRLWPRGVSKEKAALDAWMKDVAPSPELREWFDHKPERFAEFSARYQTELDTNLALHDLLRLGHEHATLTLLYAAHDPHINHAVVLRDYLKDHA